MNARQNKKKTKKKFFFYCYYGIEAITLIFYIHMEWILFFSMIEILQKVFSSIDSQSVCSVPFLSLHNNEHNRIFSLSFIIYLSLLLF